MTMQPNNASPQQHTMMLLKTDDSNEEEWYCPTCGRHFLMHWPPDYKKTVLEPGDEYVAHSGGKGGISMRGPELSQERPRESYDPPEKPEGLSEAAGEDPSLTEWARLLDEIDFESWWNDRA